MIHMYSVDDPAGLRRPELGTTGVERREEQPFGVDEIGSKERERERGQPFGEERPTSCVEGVLPPRVFIGGEGSLPWRRGKP